MSKRILASAAVALTIGLLAPQAAMAASAWTTENLNLHAGPGFNYPVVAPVHNRTRLGVAGCLRDWSWCNVEKDDGTFGWVRGARLNVESGMHRRITLMRAAPAARPQVIDYNVTEYWDEHYKTASFYGDRSRYGYNPAPNNRPPLDRAHAQGDAVSVGGSVAHMIDDHYYSK